MISLFELLLNKRQKLYEQMYLKCLLELVSTPLWKLGGVNSWPWHKPVLVYLALSGWRNSSLNSDR